MILNLNVTEILEGRGALKQDIGPSSLAWAVKFHQRVLEEGTTQIPHLPPLLSEAFPSRGKWLLPRWLPAGSSPPPGQGLLCPSWGHIPGTSSSNQAPSTAAEPAPDTPKQLNPNLALFPHLTWGQHTPPPWAAPSTGDPPTQAAASTATPELIQQGKKKSIC